MLALDRILMLSIGRIYFSHVVSSLEFSVLGIFITRNFGSPDIPFLFGSRQKTKQNWPIFRVQSPVKTHNHTSPSFATKPNQNTQPAPHSEPIQTKHTTSPSFTTKPTKTHSPSCQLNSDLKTPKSHLIG